jgi:hypothetical protein
MKADNTVDVAQMLRQRTNCQKKPPLRLICLHAGVRPDCSSQSVHPDLFAKVKISDYRSSDHGSAVSGLLTLPHRDHYQGGLPSRAAGRHDDCNNTSLLSG